MDDIVDCGEDEDEAENQGAPIHRLGLDRCFGRKEREEEDGDEKQNGSDVDGETEATQRKAGRREFLATHAFEDDTANAQDVRGK